MKRLFASMIFAGLIAAPSALAQDKKPDKPAAPTPSTTPTLPVPPAPKGNDKTTTNPSGTAPGTAPDTKGDPKKMQEEMEKAAQPGENHKWLEQMEGDWEAEVKEFNDGKEKTTKGEMTSKMVFGGRFLQSDFKGRMDNKFFYGSGIMGYNNTEKVFEGVWYDSMSTGLEKSVGKADAAGKVLTMTGSGMFPWGKSKTREVTTMVSKDKYTFDYFVMMAGKETKLMEINYTRKGKGDTKKEEKSEKKKDEKKGS